LGTVTDAAQVNFYFILFYVALLKYDVDRFRFRENCSA